jgi:hypothetical protein
MSNDNKSGPPTKGPSIPGLPVKSTPFDNSLEVRNSASRGEVRDSKRAVEVAKAHTQVRHLQEQATGHIAKSLENVEKGFGAILRIEELKEEAEVKRIQRRRRKKDEENAEFMDDQNRSKYNAAVGMQADRVMKEAQFDLAFQQLDHEQLLREKHIQILRTRLEEERMSRELHVKALPPAPAPGPDPREAQARYIVRDASEDLVKTGPEYLYHAYAGCHYLAARMRNVPHDAALKDTFDLVLDRVKLHQLTLQDAWDYQKRYDSLKGTLRAKTAAERTAATEREKAQAQVTIEQMRKEVEEHRLKTAQQMKSAFGYLDYDIQR